jgi:hypothetical protein
MLLAQSDRPATGRWQCDTNMGGKTIYATPFFEWTGLAQEVQNAFQQYLLSKYGYKERVNCRMASPGGPTLAQLDADMRGQHTQFRAQGFQVVAVPWTITSPGVTVPYACFGVAQVRRAGMADSTYVLHSKVVRIPVGTQGEFSMSWIAHLKSLHPDWYFQSPGCVLLSPDPAGHQEYIDRHVAMYAGNTPTRRLPGSSPHRPSAIPSWWMPARMLTSSMRSGSATAARSGDSRPFTASGVLRSSRVMPSSSPKAPTTVPAAD